MKKLGTPMRSAAGQMFDVADGPDASIEGCGSGSGDETGDEAGDVGAEAGDVGAESVWLSCRVPVDPCRAGAGGVFRGSG
jgi:hypothetical protein